MTMESQSPTKECTARTVARRLHSKRRDMHQIGLDLLTEKWWVLPRDEFTMFIADVLHRFLPMGKPRYTTREQRERLDLDVRFVTGFSLDDFVGPYVPRSKRGTQRKPQIIPR